MSFVPASKADVGVEYQGMGIEEGAFSVLHLLPDFTMWNLSYQRALG